MKIFGKKKGITEAVEAGADIAKAFSSKDNATERHATDMLTDNQLSKKYTATDPYLVNGAVHWDDSVLIL